MIELCPAKPTFPLYKHIRTFLKFLYVKIGKPATTPGPNQDKLCEPRVEKRGFGRNPPDVAGPDSAGSCPPSRPPPRSESNTSWTAHAA